MRPHSLGQSVEWKLGSGSLVMVDFYWPHSLGQSVEWKRHREDLLLCPCFSLGPTRWGNQLNGNAISPAPIDGLPLIKPHSLGQSVEWKLQKPPRLVFVNIGPTRWGNQLNGNTIDPEFAARLQRIEGPTRWGNQLNGNPLSDPECLSFFTTPLAPLAGAIS